VRSHRMRGDDGIVMVVGRHRTRGDEGGVACSCRMRPRHEAGELEGGMLDGGRLDSGRLDVASGRLVIELGGCSGATSSSKLSKLSHPLVAGSL
jgi:hypothetical protein